MAAQKARINRAQEMLDGWIEAEKALITAKEYRMGTKMPRREDLSEIRKAIQY